MIKREVQIFLTALGFFTRIPISHKIGFSEDKLNHAMRYFPLMGWIVGGIGALVFYFTNYIFPIEIRVILSMAATILITGAFHEDGFADVCDGFGAGWNKEQILHIMKDSRIGSYGTIGVTMILLAKFLIIFRMKPPMYIPLGLIAGHSISRFASASFVFTDKHVGDTETSKSKPLGEKISFGEFILAAAFGLLPSLWLIFFVCTGLGVFQHPVWSEAVWVIMLFMTILFLPLFLSKWLLANFFRKRIGGFTGDCLGATQQLTEVVFYLSLYVLLNNMELIRNSVIRP